MQVHVLADHRDADPARGRVDAAHHLQPLGEVRRAALQAQSLADAVGDLLLLQVDGDLVEGLLHIEALDDGLDRHAAEEGDLLAHLRREGQLGPADEDVWVDACAEEFAHAVLGGLGLQLADGVEVGDEGDVDVAAVLAADVEDHLADGFEEGLALDVADGAADFDDGDVGVMVAPDEADAALDLVGEVGDDLDGLALEVVAVALLADDVAVDLAGGDVGEVAEVFVDKPLVVAEVEVGLGAVIGDVDLAVLEGIHQAGVDVDVGIDLDEGNAVAAALEETAEGSGGNALADRRHNATSHEDILHGHSGSLQNQSGTASGRHKLTRSPGGRFMR